MQITSGIPQRLPLSGILYLFYNADLLEDINPHDSSSSLGYIDDIGILVIGNSTEENCRSLATIHEMVCKPWADTHGSSFAVSKYQLIHFTRRTSSNINHRLLLSSGQQVTPMPSVVYLGIIFDVKLKWNAQLALIKAKVQKSIGALASLGGSTWGASLQVIRKIYIAVVISQMTYGLSIWYTPSGEPRHNKSQLALLETLQYKAQKTISGAFSATSKSALNIETYIPPIKIRLNRFCESALKIATSPAYKDIIACRSQRRIRVRSNLKTLLNHIERKTQIKPETVEPSCAYLASPWWTPPKITIAASKELAISHHNNTVYNDANTSLLPIYTDGSGINGKIGASAVTSTISDQAYLGPDTQYTVFTGKLYVIFLALNIAFYVISIEQRTGIKMPIIYTDNQAALRRVKTPNSKGPGQSILKQVINLIDRLQLIGATVEFNWIPAYRNIKGNEAADHMAKTATSWLLKRQNNGRTTETDTGTLAPKATNTLTQKAPVQTMLARLAASEWDASWSQDTHGKDLRKLVQKPSRTVLKLHNELPKGLSSLLIQMHNGKIGLRKYLHGRKVPEISTPTCQCGQAPQSVTHVLAHCRKYSQIRRETWKEEEKNHAWRSIPVKEMLSSPRYAKKAAMFMKKTGLLGQFKALRTETDDINVTDAFWGDNKM